MDDCEESSAEELELRWRRRQRPDNEVPASVAFDAVLVDTDTLVIFLSGLRVYTGGVEFVLQLRAAPTGSEDEDEYLGHLLHGHRGADGLLIGIEFGDGRSCANVGTLQERSTDESSPMLHSGGGGGGARAADASYFLSPLPPPGDLKLVTALPDRGVAESTVLLPTEAILDAASRARVLWPWEPQRRPRRKPRRPQLEPDGWFAQQLEAGSAPE